MIYPYGLISIQWIGTFQSGFGSPPDFKTLVITFINNFNQPTQRRIPTNFQKMGQECSHEDQDSYRPGILA